MSGTTTYSPRVLDKLAVAAASSVPGVQATSGSWAGLGTAAFPRCDARIDPIRHTVDVTCTLAVSWPAPVTAVAERVQRAIVSWLSTLTDLKVGSVSVGVEQAVASEHRVSDADVAGSPDRPPLAEITVRPGVTVFSPQVRPPVRVRKPSIRPPVALVPVVTASMREVHHVL